MGTPTHDPNEITQRDEVQRDEATSDVNSVTPAAPQLASSSPPGSPLPRNWGQGIAFVALAAELYQWIVGHGFVGAPWWGPPAAIILTCLPSGVWVSLGSTAIHEAAERLTKLKKP